MQKNINSRHFYSCLLFFFGSATLFSCHENQKASNYVQGLVKKDSIRVVREKRVYDHLFFHKKKEGDYFSIHYKGDSNLLLYNVDNNDSIEFYLANNARLINGNSAFIGDSILIYFNENFQNENYLELHFVNSNNESFCLTDSIWPKDTSFVSYPYTTKYSNLRSFGNHIFIPIYNKKKSSTDYAFRASNDDSGNFIGTPCELHYQLDIKTKQLKFKGLIGNWPLHYLKRLQIDGRYYRDYFVDRSGDSCVVMSFNENDTVYIYNIIDGTLKGTQVIGMSQNTDFPNSPFTQDLNEQFERYMTHKSYREIWADENAIYRLVTFPTPIAKNEFRKRKMYEKYCSLYIVEHGKEFDAKFTEVKCITPAEWYPVFYGQNGFYIMSKIYPNDPIHTVLYYNRYSVSL